MLSAAPQALERLYRAPLVLPTLAQTLAPVGETLVVPVLRAVEPFTAPEQGNHASLVE